MHRSGGIAVCVRGEVLDGERSFGIRFQMKFRFKLAMQLVLWEYAFYQLGRKDTTAALRTIWRAERFGELIPAQKVFKGNLLLIARRFDEAKEIWRQVVEQHGSDLAPNTRYAFLSARANLNAVAGKLDLCAKDERDAVELRCSRLIKRLLPSPKLIAANDSL